MMNDLLSLTEKFNNIKSELLHGGYTGDFLEETVLDVLVDEILKDFDESIHDNIRELLIDMYFTGRFNAMREILQKTN